jgi:hypothetical protein
MQGKFVTISISNDLQRKYILNNVIKYITNFFPYFTNEAATVVVHMFENSKST